MDFDGLVDGDLKTYFMFDLFGKHGEFYVGDNIRQVHNAGLHHYHQTELHTFW
eukprot:gene11038-2654_t